MTISQSGCTILHSHQQCASFSVPLCPLKYLVWLVFLIFVIQIGVQ